MPPWSSGLGHRPLTAATGVRIPLEVPETALAQAGAVFYSQNTSCRRVAEDLPEDGLEQMIGGQLF